VTKEYRIVIHSMARRCVTQIGHHQLSLSSYRLSTTCIIFERPSNASC